MRKKLLDAPPEAGAIETYTSDLSRRLRGAVPGERADEIVREAEAHLHDQADTIANESKASVPRQDAEAQAVAAFVSPVAFARDMVRSAVETRHSKAWYATGKAVITLLLCGQVAGIVFDGTVDFRTARGVGGSGFSGICCLLLWPTLCLCAFLARRTQTTHLVRSFTLVSAFLFVYTGFFYAMRPQSGTSHIYSISRLKARNEYKGWHDTRLHAEQDEKRLIAGLNAYRAKNPVVPDELKIANGTAYLVPGAILPGMNFAYNIYLIRTGQYSTYYYPLDRSYRASVKTIAEARSHWLADSPAYLTQARYEQKYARGYEEPLWVARQQTGFSVKTGWWWATNIFPGLLYPLILDWLFAKLGRAAYAKRRARRERKASHA